MGDKKPDQSYKDDGYDAERSWDRFEGLTRKLLKVPKEELDKEREKREQEKKRVG